MREDKNIDNNNINTKGLRQINYLHGNPKTINKH